MTTAGKEEALLPNDSQGEKQPEVFGRVQSGFVSNNHSHHWTPHFALTQSPFFHQLTKQKPSFIMAEGHRDKD